MRSPHTTREEPLLTPTTKALEQHEDPEQPNKQITKKQINKQIHILLNKRRQTQKGICCTIPFSQKYKTGSNRSQDADYPWWVEGLQEPEGNSTGASSKSL